MSEKHIIEISVNPKPKQQLSKLDKIFKEPSPFLILTHGYPDPDAFVSKIFASGLGI